jgi:hypothetical protein
MQYAINKLVGHRMEAHSGDVGTVVDFYFDDQTWAVRYLVVKMDPWTLSKKVLISPASLVKEGCKSGIFQVNATQDQIRNSPSIDVDKPISRQQEIELYGHYAWTGYWESGFYGGGMALAPGAVPEIRHQTGANLHLRSSSYVTGFHVHGTDGEIGIISDFMIDDDTWTVLYLLIVSSHLPAHKTLCVPIGRINQMQWSDSDIYLNITMAEVENGAAYAVSAYPGLKTAL